MYRTPDEIEAIRKARATYHRTYREDNRIRAPIHALVLFVSAFSLFAYVGWVWFKALSA